MKAFAFLSLLFSAGLLLAAEQQQPTISYQGRLKNLTASSAALSQTIQIRFALYTQAEGGKAHWEEVVAVTPDSDGIFSTTLFEGCGVKTEASEKTFAETLVYGKEQNGLWLGLTIGEDSTKELKPRHAIGMVPCAHRARFTYRAQKEFTVPETLTAQKLSASTITTQDCTIRATHGATELKHLRVSNALTAASLTAENKVENRGSLTLKGDVESNDLAPIGSIILWYGSKDAVPEGWEIYEELSGRFPLGANDEYELNAQGGESTIKLTLSQLPAHTHTLHYKQPSSTSGDTWLAKDVDWNEETWAGSNTATVTLNAQSPNNQAFTRMPPYKALYYIQRVPSNQ